MYFHRKENEIEKPIFIIGVPRSGTTIIADLISFHEDLAWFSNHYSKHPKLQALSLLNRLIDIPKIGPKLKGNEIHKKKNSLKASLPYPREAYSIWDLYCTTSFSRDYLVDRKPIAIEKKESSRSSKTCYGIRVKNDSSIR